MAESGYGDEYATMAEIPRPVHGRAMGTLKTLERGAFSGLDGSATVLEVGAGTGIGTAVIGAETSAAMTVIERRWSCGPR